MHPPPEKPTLDKDLEKFTLMETATRFVLKRAAAPGLGLIFLTLSALLAILHATGIPNAALIVAAAAMTAYMAMNIGANDVTNNVGAAVGAQSMSMAAALALAAVCEIAGAMLAGSDVVATIRQGIVEPSEIGDPQRVILVMTAALLSAAIWINIAIWANAPVSTTHSIVGGVVGAGGAALGFGAIKWPLMVDRLRLGDLAAGWRADCGGVPLVHQAQYYLPR